jgi:hypothetical protein
VQLKKLNNSIIAARVVIFICAGVSCVAGLRVVYIGYVVRVINDGLSGVLTFSGIGILYLLLALLSFKRPGIPILLAAIANSSLFITWLIVLIRLTSTKMLFNVACLAIQAIFIFLLLNGVVAAKKFKKLSGTIT